MKRYENYGRNLSWIVKRSGKYGRKVSWIVKRYRKYRRKLWNDMENIEENKKNDHHDIAEILLKVALNTITLTLTHSVYNMDYQSIPLTGSDFT